MVAVSLKKPFFQAEDGIRDVERSRGLGDVYKRQDGRTEKGNNNIPELSLESAGIKNIYKIICFCDKCFCRRPCRSIYVGLCFKLNKVNI